MVAFLIGFFGFAGFNSGVLVDRLERADPRSASEALPTLFLAISFLTLVTSLGSSFHHLFMAPDLELLLAAPVPRRSFFWLKVFETWRDSVHVLLFQAAALVGYGVALHLGAPFYVGAELLGIALTLGAAAVGLTLTLVLARLRFGEPILGVLRLVSILLFVPIGLLGIPTLGIGRGRFSPALSQGTVQTISSSLRSLGPPPPWLPSTWAASLARVDADALASAVLLCAAAVVLVGTAQFAFDRLFQFGYERARFAAPRATTRQRTNGKRAAATGPVLGILLKDWRTLLRDPRWRSSAVISLVALGLPAVAVITGDPFARAEPTARFWLGLLPVPYLAYIFGSQQGAATLAYEGRNIALLRSAPVSIERVVLGKVLGGLVLVLAVTLSLTLVLSLAHGGQPAQIGEALLAATWLGVWATTAAVAGAALTVDFESENPQRRVGCLGAIVTSFLSAFFFLSNTLLLGWGVVRAIGAVPRPYVAFAPVLDFGLAALAVVSVAAIGLAAYGGVRRLAGWEAS